MKYPVCCAGSGGVTVGLPVPYVSSWPLPSSTAWSGISGHSVSGRPNSDAHAPCLFLAAAAAERENWKSPPSPATVPAETTPPDIMKSLRRIFCSLNRPVTYSTRTATPDSPGHRRWTVARPLGVLTIKWHLCKIKSNPEREPPPSTLASNFFNPRASRGWLRWSPIETAGAAS
jgi:hypothetical protein